MAIRKWIKALVSPSHDDEMGPRRDTRSMVESEMRAWDGTGKRRSVAGSAPEKGTTRPLLARMFGRKSSHARYESSPAAMSGPNKAPSLSQRLPSFVDDADSHTALDARVIVDVVHRLGRIFAHVPFLVEGAAAMTYMGHAASRPNHITVTCPPNALGVMLGTARDMRMPFSSSMPSTFYVQTGYATLCCVRVRPRRDYATLTPVQNGKLVMSLASLAGDAAAEFLDAERRREPGVATKVAADIFWLLNRMMEDPRAHGVAGRDAGMLGRVDFLRRFVAQYPRARPALERAGVSTAPLDGSNVRDNGHHHRVGDNGRHARDNGHVRGTGHVRDAARGRDVPPPVPAKNTPRQGHMPAPHQPTFHANPLPQVRSQHALVERVPSANSTSSSYSLPTEHPSPPTHTAVPPAQTMVPSTHMMLPPPPPPKPIKKQHHKTAKPAAASSRIPVPARPSRPTADLPHPREPATFPPARLEEDSRVATKTNGTSSSKTNNGTSSKTTTRVPPTGPGILDQLEPFVFVPPRLHKHSLPPIIGSYQSMMPAPLNIRKKAARI